jgi:antibiotic biosynthesis monooxygenase (ABM) superfamily enzyme
MQPLDTSGVTGIVWRRVHPEHEAAAEDIMKQLMLLSRTYIGYLGSEVFPPVPGVQDAYVVLYRFGTSEHLRSWLDSPQRATLLQQVESLLTEPSREFFIAHRGRSPGSASTVLAYHIREGCEEAFHAWRTRILEASRRSPGFLGAEAFDTLDQSSRAEFIVVLRFDTREHLDAWMASDTRTRFLKEVRPLIHEYRIRRQGTGFEGWFDISAQQQPPAPWRQGLIVLTALFPVIMSLRTLLSPLFQIFPLPVAFLILLAVDMSILTYLIMPRFSRLMSFWLKPKLNATWRTELAGWAIILTIISITLTISLLARL